MKNNKLHIYMDFDETLVDSIEACLVILNKRYGTNFKPEQVKAWDFRDCFPQLGETELEDIFDNQEFFDNLTWKPYAKTFLSYYNSDAKFTIITKGNSNNLELKRKWLDKEGIDWVDFIGLSLNESKGIVDMSDGILIDDCRDNLNESNAPIKILFKNYSNTEWNKGWHGLHVIDFHDLEFLLDSSFKLFINYD